MRCASGGEQKLRPARHEPERRLPAERGAHGPVAAAAADAPPRSAEAARRKAPRQQQQEARQHADEEKRQRPSSPSSQLLLHSVSCSSARRQPTLPHGLGSCRRDAQPAIAEVRASTRARKRWKDLPPRAEESCCVPPRTIRELRALFSMRPVLPPSPRALKMCSQKCGIRLRPYDIQFCAERHGCRRAEGGAG